MDSPTGSDLDMPQQTAVEESLLSKKMKIIIILLSLVLIILLLPFASDLGVLPLLRPMGQSLLQRLWDAMRFIAMTAAISIGIISTSHSSQRKGNGSMHHRSLGNQTPPSSPEASIRAPVNPSFSNMDVSASPLHPDDWYRARKDVDDCDVQDKARNSRDFNRVKGKQVVDDKSPLTTASGSGTSAPHPSREDDWFYTHSKSPNKAMHRRQFQRILDEEDDLKPCMHRRRNSASDAWFLTARIDEEVEEEPGEGILVLGKAETSIESHKKASPLYGSNHEIKQVPNWSPDQATTSDVWSSTTGDNYAGTRTRRSASRLADYENGRPRRRSASLDRHPLHKDDSAQGLRQILDLGSSSNQTSGSRLARSSIRADQSQVGTLHKSKPLEHQLVENKTASSHRILQEEDDNKIGPRQPVQNKLDSKAYNQVGSGQVQMASQKSSQKQPQGTKIYLNNQNAENRGDFKMVDENSGHHGALLRKGHELKGSELLTNEQLPRKIKDTDQDDTSMTYKRRPSTSKLLLQNSKHSQSDLNLQQLEQNYIGPQYAKPARSLAHARGKKSFSYDFGDDFNPEWLLELEPPLPPGFDSSDQQQHQHGNNLVSPIPEQRDSRQAPRTNPSKSQLVQSLVPWRASVPINISGHQQREVPSPPPHEEANSHAATNTTSSSSSSSSSNVRSPGEVSPGEVNRRAADYITKVNTDLLRQRQESLERRRRLAESSHEAGQNRYH